MRKILRKKLTRKEKLARLPVNEKGERYRARKHLIIKRKLVNELF